MRRQFFTFLLTLISFWIISIALQNSSVYNNTLGLVSKNWENINGGRKLVPHPYTIVNNINYVRWDGLHYQLIKNYGYNVVQSGGDYIFAFFPLFPLIWRTSNLPPVGVLFLNYLFFSFSIFILIGLFSAKERSFYNTILSLSLPGLVIFFIPYSEATFFLMVTLGIYGFIKNRYWIYFIGFLLASLTRPAYTILGLGLLFTEIYFLIGHRNILLSLKNIFARTLPLIVGTAIVSGIQLEQGSGSVYKFIQVQKYWGNVLTIPHNLKDWSHEGFAINLGVIFLIFTPLIVIMALKCINQLHTFSANKALKDYNQRHDYIITLSTIYLIGFTLFIIFFRGGSLNCLFRFTLCSPFAYILLFGAFRHIKHIDQSYRLFTISTLSLLSVFVLGLADYSTEWNFSDFGIFILILTIFLWLFQDHSDKLLYKLALYSNLLINIIWTTYLFNTYINDGWIFA